MRMKTAIKSVVSAVEKRMTGRTGKAARKAIESIPQADKVKATAQAMFDAGELTREALDKVLAA
jgi:hypothetical protein